MPRDFQRSKVYAAERSAFTFSPEFTTIDECDDFARIITGCSYWLLNNGKTNYRLHDGRGHRSAYFKRKSNTIVLPRWARSRFVIIHEFSHFLTFIKHGDSVPSHGRVFCRHYLDLISELMGADSAALLERAFMSHGVKYNLSDH